MRGRFRRMDREPRPMPWPSWATFAVAAVIVTCLVTIAATINDIW
jgi:hypothetical protein